MEFLHPRTPVTLGVSPQWTANGRGLKCKQALGKNGTLADGQRSCRCRYPVLPSVALHLQTPVLGCERTHLMHTAGGREPRRHSKLEHTLRICRGADPFGCALDESEQGYRCCYRQRSSSRPRDSTIPFRLFSG